MKMPKDEQRYWHNLKSKMPPMEEAKQMASKDLGDIEALRKENEGLKKEIRQLSMKY